MTDIDVVGNKESPFEQLTIVVVTYQSMAVVPMFLQILYHQLNGRACRVLICDNASDDGIVEFMERAQWPNVEMLRSDVNEGFGAGLNRGILAAKTDYVALMNPDVVIQEGVLEKLLESLMQHPDVAGISPQILSASSFDDAVLGEPWHGSDTIRLHKGFESIWSRMMFYSGLQTKFPKVSMFVPWSEVAAQGRVQVTRFHGCFGMFRRTDLLSIGMFDPRFFLFFEEDDLGYRFARARKKLYVHCEVGVFHLSGKGSCISGSSQTDKILLNSQYMFFRKHFGLLYAWSGFALVWLTISMLLLYQCCFSKGNVQQYKKLWHWHWECIKQKGSTPKETIPDECKHMQNFNWKDI